VLDSEDHGDIEVIFSWSSKGRSGFLMKGEPVDIVEVKELIGDLVVQILRLVRILMGLRMTRNGTLLPFPQAPANGWS
jgi:hypothetical protein